MAINIPAEWESALWNCGNVCWPVVFLVQGRRSAEAIASSPAYREHVIALEGQCHAELRQYIARFRDEFSFVVLMDNTEAGKRAGKTVAGYMEAAGARYILPEERIYQGRRNAAEVLADPSGRREFWYRLSNLFLEGGKKQKRAEERNGDT